jgi:hypothetical protein
MQLQLLGQLAARPGNSATLAQLAWGLGRGLGEHLLQLQLWALQVGSGRLAVCSL